MNTEQIPKYRPYEIEILRLEGVLYAKSPNAYNEITEEDLDKIDRLTELLMNGSRFFTAHQKNDPIMHIYTEKYPTSETEAITVKTETRKWDEIKHLIKPNYIDLTEKTTMTFDLLNRVEEHDEFETHNNEIIFEDKGLKIQLIESYMGGVTGLYRIGYKDTIITHNGFHVDTETDTIISKTNVIKGNPKEIYDAIEESGLQWCTLQEQAEESTSKGESEAEKYYKSYIGEFCEFVTDMYIYGIPMC